MIDLGQCIVGKNLNIWTVRGYSNLNILADISAADEFDKVKNETGTQRDLKTKHSQEAYLYAKESDFVDNLTSPRAFPEITLNARDKNTIVLKLDNGNEFDFDSSIDPGLGDEFVVQAFVKTSALVFPKPKYNPQISRVDGNHRLSQADSVEIDEENDEVKIRVPFSLYVGLSAEQERTIFSVFNGKHVGMPPAIITSFSIMSKPAEIALTKPIDRSRWLAEQLTRPNYAFYGKVHFGGGKEGAIEEYGSAPTMTIQGLSTGVKFTLDNSSQINSYFFTDLTDEELSSEELNSQAKQKERVDKGYQMLELLNRYWTAVRDAFPLAWEDKKNYILMSSIGINGFSSLAGPVIENLLLVKQTYQYEHFKSVMDYMAANFDASKDSWRGIAGAGGAKMVASKLTSIWAQNEIHIAVATSDLRRQAGSILDQ